jgi:DNA-binding CsgD family transcriptional regulator
VDVSDSVITVLFSSAGGGERVATASLTMKKGSTMRNAPSSSVLASEKDFDLTPFERQIIALTVAGYSSQESAKRVGISEPALKRHLSKICDKLRVSNPLELILFALHHRLIDTH